MKKEQISPDFLKVLENDGFSVQALLTEIRDEDSFSEALRKIRQQTGSRYSKRIIKRGLNGRSEVTEINPEIAGVIDRFKSWRGRRWILEEDETRKNEKLLVDDLKQFAGGQPTDFTVWNCLGFEWQQEPNSGYPPCRITDNLDVSIVLYFLPRLKQVAEQLSSIGNPTIIPMIPSSEATYESMWNYLQDRETRELIVNSAVAGLKEKLTDVEFPTQATVTPMRWDEYLNSRGITKEPEVYSQEGEQRIWQSDDIDRILEEATDNGVEYFGSFGIEVDPEKIAGKRIRYSGMYAGEGAAITDIRDAGRNVVIINFEEFRVAKMTLRGANGKLPIVTPITDEEMTQYYQWENRKKKGEI